MNIQLEAIRRSTASSIAMVSLADGGDTGFKQAFLAAAIAALAAAIMRKHRDPRPSQKV